MDSVLQNGFYNGVSAFIRAGASVLAIPLLIRLVGAQDYGLWILVSAVIGLAMLAEAGLSMSTTVFVSRDLAANDLVAVMQTLIVVSAGMLTVATGMALVLGLAAHFLVGLFPTLEPAQRASGAQALQIGGIVLWTRLLQQVLVGIEQAYRRYGILNLLNTSQAVLGSLGLIAVAWLGGRVVEFMQWQAVTNIGLLLAHLWVGYQLIGGGRLRLTWNRARAIAIVRYSLWTWVASLGSALFSYVDRLIVGALLGTSVVAVYGAITTITGQINSFSSLPIQPILPVLSSWWAERVASRPILLTRARQVIQTNGLIALGLGVVLFTSAPVLMRIVLSTAVSDQWILAFRIATVIYAVYSLNAVGYYILFATGAVRACTGVVLISGVVSLLLIAAGGALHGGLGAVVGNGGYLFTLALTVVGMRRLQIPSAVWIRWILFPLAWFVITLAANSFVPGRMGPVVTVLLVECIAAAVWFARAQQVGLRSLFVRTSAQP